MAANLASGNLCQTATCHTATCRTATSHAHRETETRAETGRETGGETGAETETRATAEGRDGGARLAVDGIDDREGRRISTHLYASLRIQQVA